MKKALAMLALVAALFVAVQRPSYAILDKTRFTLHMGAAFFAFHHWVYGPYRQGMFAAGSPNRTKAIIKGGAALIFAVYEIRKADTIAHNSNSRTLHALVRPLDAMGSAFSTIGQKMRGGRFDPGDIATLNSDVGAVGAGSSAAGMPIKDVPVAIPG